ncbi:hypothetical protein APASM_4802 [Actinosynnema pretiosum subsp. pretiosum]|nr:hypothetical protein APASM_4802 [Actinosynnema pretiosum subsp. pretiosum]
MWSRRVPEGARRLFRVVATAYRSSRKSTPGSRTTAAGLKTRGAGALLVVGRRRGMWPKSLDFENPGRDPAV